MRAIPVIHLALVRGRPGPYGACRLVGVDVDGSVLRLNVRSVRLRGRVVVVGDLVIDVLVLVDVADLSVLEGVLEDEDEISLGECPLPAGRPVLRLGR